MKYLAPIVYCLALSITACSNSPDKKNWNREIPPEKFFSAYYQEDIPHQAALSERDYLMWVNRFYFGWQLYRRGWMQATEELVASLPKAQDKQNAKRLMLQIGNLIGPEWAKNKKYRLINTRHLGIWGDAISASIVNHQQMAILNNIMNDAKALLKKDIPSQLIMADRYYPQEDFEYAELL
ncbi:MAG: hypothetical protein ACJATV_000900 [Granulosicoccus sp.]|jgi:hypothetical protein